MERTQQALAHSQEALGEARTQAGQQSLEAEWGLREARDQLEEALAHSQAALERQVEEERARLVVSEQRAVQLQEQLAASEQRLREQLEASEQQSTGFR